MKALISAEIEAYAEAHSMAESETCSARPRNRKSIRFPSCGCSQLSFVVGMGPRLSRSMFVAFVAAVRNDSSLLITVPTKVGPIRLSISA